jgi:hypothetical protein
LKGLTLVARVPDSTVPANPGNDAGVENVQYLQIMTATVKNVTMPT